MARFLVIPDMLANSQDGFIASADGELTDIYGTTYYAYRAFDRSTNASWVAGAYDEPPDASHWLEIQCPVPTQVVSYKLYMKTTAYLIDWVFEGWNGSEWVALHEVTGHVQSLNAYTEEYVLSNPVTFTKYRIFTTNWIPAGQNNCVIYELALYDEGDTNILPDMTSNTTPSGICSADQNGLSGLSQVYRWYKPYSYSSILGNWDGSLKSPPHWTQYDWDTEQRVVNAFSFATGNSQWPIPTDLELLGSNNGVDWDVLHTISDYSAPYETYSPIYEIASPAAYQIYRLNITDWDDTYNDVGFGGLRLYGYDPNYVAPPIDFNFDPVVAAWALGKFGNPDAVAFDFSPVPALYSLAPDPFNAPAADLGEFLATVPALTFEPRTDLPASIIYRITLTGAADGKTDVELPVTSFQSRLRNNKPTYLSVVVTNGEKYAPEVIDRPNGEIVIQRGLRYKDGTEALVEIVRVLLDDVQDAGGGFSRSLVLSGYATIDHGTPKSITLKGVRYRSSSGSGRRVRANLDLNLRAGDTAIFGAESMVVDLITYIVSVDNGAAQEMMELAE